MEELYMSEKDMKLLSFKQKAEQRRINREIEKRRKTMEETDLYFITDGCGNYKIGVSKNVLVRMHELNAGNPNILRIVKLYNNIDARKTEKRLHLYFSEKKIHREWFRLTKKDLIEVYKKIEGGYFNG